MKKGPRGGVKHASISLFLIQANRHMLNEKRGAKGENEERVRG
jgi:hypothetical protein